MSSFSIDEISAETEKAPHAGFRCLNDESIDIYQQLSKDRVLTPYQVGSISTFALPVVA
jgi:hypothetical protein